MQRLLGYLLLAFLAPAAWAQTPAPAKEQAPSSFYPAPPPEQAPKVDKGAPITGLTSPLGDGPRPITSTTIASDAEAQLFANAVKIVWGRHAKIKGAKSGEVSVTKQGALWLVKGRIDSVAPGTEGDWAAVSGTVERIGAGVVQMRGEVSFRVAKIQGGTPCKVAGTLTFKRSGKSQVWRLVEGDNPCDGTQEMFDLVYEKPGEKKPTPAQQKKS